MAWLKRPDGVELYWEEDGEGPLVVLAPYWSGHPGVYGGLTSELARDHRVVVWDARGTGQSTRSGPYDTETDCGDLEAILERAGGAAIVIATANGMNHTVHVATRRQDLVRAVVALGTAPLARAHFEGSEGLIASDNVVNAFIEMLARDYRGALRTLLRATNSQMSEDELRERVAFQVSYCPQEAAASRVRAWLEDDPTEDTRQAGDRLWIFSAPDVAGPWLPSADERRRLIETLAPDAHVEETEPGEGPVSHPELTADAIRRIREPRRV